MTAAVTGDEENAIQIELYFKYLQAQSEGFDGDFQEYVTTEIAQPILDSLQQEDESVEEVCLLLPPSKTNVTAHIHCNTVADYSSVNLPCCVPSVVMSCIMTPLHCPGFSYCRVVDGQGCMVCVSKAGCSCCAVVRRWCHVVYCYAVYLM